jgi:flagellar L-ring protein FlgH
MKRYFLLTAFLPLAGLLCGCFPFEQSRIAQEPFNVDSVHRYRRSPVEVQPAGTIYRGDQASNFFGDQRARMLGDIVTVKIVEISQASEKATTDTGRDSSLNVGISNLLGQEVRYPANHPAISPANLIKANTTNNFAGSGETTRSGSVTATITARVVEVLPTGNLAVEGKREIYVNNEKKEILLQGIVRPRDIAADNSVLSTQVADAKILLTGIGVVGEKQRPGWLSRILDGIWPF